MNYMKSVCNRKRNWFLKMWLEKKANMVRMREMSTLRAFLELEKNGEDLKKDWNQTFSGKSRV